MSAPDHKRKSQAAFDRQAARYDTEMYGRHARRLHGEVMTAVEGFEFAAVLDVGCGTGATLEAIVGAHPDVRAWGIDLSPEMIAKPPGSKSPTLSTCRSPTPPSTSSSASTRCTTTPSRTRAWRRCIASLGREAGS